MTWAARGAGWDEDDDGGTPGRRPREDISREDSRVGPASRPSCKAPLLRAASSPQGGPGLPVGAGFLLRHGVTRGLWPCVCCQDWPLPLPGAQLLCRYPPLQTTWVTFSQKVDKASRTTLCFRCV